MNFFKSKKVQATLLILFAIILEVVPTVIYCQKNTAALFPEILCYASQIVSSVFVISGVVIAVWQYYLSSKSAKTDLEIIQVQRAIDLSEYYKDNILRYYPAIHYIFYHSGIIKILDTIKTEQMRNFDSNELKKLFTQSQIDELKKIQNTDKFIQAVFEANAIYNLDLKIHSSKTEIVNGHSKKVTISFDRNSVIVAFMSNLVNGILNNLEYFALHFKHHTADESVIYQSLHQSYLEIIPYMYYYIANNNTDPTSKFYTNVIWLFNEWKTKKYEKDADLSQKTLDLQSHGTIIKTKY